MIFMLDVWIATTGIMPLDIVFQLSVVSILATVIWSTGICHSFNLIDGVNGLASGFGIVVAAGLWWIAYDTGQMAFAAFSFALIPALLGFMVFNWPFGRIFLGDAGAYGIGHVLVWLSILLVWYAPDVSTLGLTLLFFWPVADTFLAIWRRRKTGRAVDEPDRMHFHQLVYRLLVQITENRLSPRAVNSLTGLVILPLASVPVISAVMLYDAPYLALLAWVVYGLLFTLAYMAGVNLFRRRKYRRTRAYPFKSHPAVKPETAPFV
jgi:UDP-N-acetylmuramyl pentapeptide phosphotransferase/UDP-N-acetylglucosamine-1-phosphate transferase